MTGLSTALGMDLILGMAFAASWEIDYPLCMPAQKLLQTVHGFRKVGLGGGIAHAHKALAALTKGRAGNGGHMLFQKKLFAEFIGSHAG